MLSLCKVRSGQNIWLASNNIRLCLIVYRPTQTHKFHLTRHGEAMVDFDGGEVLGGGATKGPYAPTEEHANYRQHNVRTVLTWRVRTTVCKCK